MQIIRGVIRNYDWGDHRALAGILGHRPTGEPEAEYWLGAHPSAPSVIARSGRSLEHVIAADPAAAVGPEAAARFGGMPYLFKLLAAERPLSIQVHPDLEQASVGFAREEAAGVDRSAPERNYRDDNHKPELICALSAFEAKCGFRPVRESSALIAALAAASDSPLLDELNGRLSGGGPDEMVMADVVAWLLRLPEAEAASLTGATGRAAPSVAVRSPFAVALEWAVRMAEAFPRDAGVVVALLLNHVSLKPGQAIFLRAGNLHSYLSGVGVELMANSDNVLRGGLTTKHVDVDELLRVVDTRPGSAPIQLPSGSVHRYDSPVPEFALTRLDSTAEPFTEQHFAPIGPDIVLVTSGRVSLVSVGSEVDVAAGSSAFVGFGDGPYRLVDRAPGRTVAWRASIGQAQRT